MNIVQRFVKREDLRSARQSNKQLNVVVTGGSRGLGRAMCEQFLCQGDRVVMISRHSRGIESHKNMKVIEKSVMDMGELSFDHRVDLWINNAAISGGFRHFAEHNDSKVKEILETNLIGTALGSKHAYELMKDQPCGGAIFNMAGTGSNGFPTRDYSLYGASKAGVVQLTRTLQSELKDTNVGVHIVSPGMMNTDLLLENMPETTYKIIKRFCTAPEIVADTLVMEMKDAYYNADTNAFIQYMTVSRVIKRLVDKN
jgi:chlorophyll(ide) b reductase